MTREELIELGEKIINSEGAEQEIDKIIELFDKNVPHPNGINLFSYPENFNARNDDLSKYNPTVHEIVDKCLNYKSIIQ